MSFLDYLNKGHPSIKFTLEVEVNGQLPFLDVLVSHSNYSANFRTTTFHKSTYTGLLMNFLSFAPFTYKTGLVRTLLDRAHKINNSEISLNIDIKRIFCIFQKNLFPLYLLRNIFHKYKQSSQITRNSSDNREVASVHYYKLPYIGSYSFFVKNKINELVNSYCNGRSKIKLIFTTCKIGKYLSTKDSVPTDLKSHLIYKFVCSNCNVSYIGQTSRHFGVRVNEHLGLVKGPAPTSVTKHLVDDRLCKLGNDSSSFSILDFESGEFTRRLKEALWVKKESPILNRQVKSEKLNLIS